MSYFIIIRGPLAVGKSTIAKQLAKNLGAEYISVDKVMEDNGLDKVDPDSGIPVENFIKGNEISLPKIKDCLKSGKSVIVDGCFYYQEQIEHFLNNVDNVKVFTLKASVETCIERDSKREKIYGEDAARYVYFIVNKFNFGTVIDTEGKTSTDVVEEMKVKL
jgi:predicted kinase